MAESKVNATTVTIIVGVVGFLLIWNVLFGDSKEDKQQQNLQIQADDARNNTITNLTNNGVRQTWPDSQYKLFADSLETALGGWFTEDELAASRVFEHILNKIDFLKLEQYFGIRDEMTMGQWVTKYLNSAEIKQINNMLTINNVGMKF